METLHHPDAPPAVGPYAQAIAAGGGVFCSGQMPPVPATRRSEATTIEELANLNTGYVEVFGAPRPARPTVEVSRRPPEALVVIECSAILPDAR